MSDSSRSDLRQRRRSRANIGMLALCGILAALPFLATGESRGGDDPRVQITAAANAWLATSSFPAPEANQAAAATDKFVFAITNTLVAKYDRSTGKRIAVSTGDAKHLNSGFLWQGKLYCAHSNYPQTPERSEIKVLDIESMQLSTFKDFGSFGGSLTWAVQQEGYWWCNFARYGADNGATFLVKYDEAWREQTRWTYPPELIQKLGQYSLSGGIWRDGHLLVTGHDDPMLFRLRLPSKGTVLEFVDSQTVPFTGQGFASDSQTGGLVGINRSKKQVVFASQKEKPAQALLPFIESHCLDCHNTATKQAGLALDELLQADVDRNLEAWEKVVRKLIARQMPPPKAPRPAERDFNAVVAELEGSLDAIAAKSPNPGRTETFRRLNRTEYQNTIRDLLGLEIDVAALLPADESSHGFDNVTVADLSPTLLNRYISAAQKISRLAVGGGSRTPGGDIFRIRPDVTQDVHIAGLPLGTRGGTLVSYNFPQDGEYEVQVHLMRDRNEGIEGLGEPHELEVLLDRERQALFPIKPARDGNDQAVDANLKVRMKVKAGAHKIGVAFLKKPSSLLETRRQPLNVHFNFYRHPRIGPAVYEVAIVGPFEASGPGESESRRRTFTSRPKGSDDEEDCAKRILSDLARRAYRRPVDDEDLQAPLELYRQGRAEGGFEAGIELALSSLLVKPQFLFRIERDPSDLASGTAYRIQGVELASRLSYFLWSSMPDEELLELAIRGDLNRPEILEQQVRRMLADARSKSLVTNFAGQWLYLRNLDAAVPDMRLFPDFDDNLRQALRSETELFFESVLREDRSVLDLIHADYTYLNERLAKHYGIPHVYGSRFRRVPIGDDSHRGGLLRQGSILTVTSYATRTSPVIRGHWILQNFVGTPPPPAPPNVPALDDNTVSSSLSMRERLQQHRSNAACASCHQQMDPVGFSLENYDAVGRWRGTDAGLPIDVAGGMIDGSEFSGVSGLEHALLSRPELFVRTLTEKLFTFSLGRGVEYYDHAAIRQIVRNARQDNYRFSRLILGIVTSTPFQMRNSQ